VNVIKFIAIGIGILGIGALPVAAQPSGTYDWCGTLEDFEGCVAMYAIWPGPMGPVVLTEYGGFGPGDQVHVVGEYNGQFAICGGFEDVPVVAVTTIEPCALDYCGDLFEYRGCLLFNNREGELYGLSNYGSYGAGDVVRVTGNFVAGYQVVCDGGARFALMDVATIEPCQLESCCRGVVDGDLTGDGSCDLSDLMCFTAFLFVWPPDSECCMDEANVNGDAAGTIDLSDLIYLVNFVFLGGPAPHPLPCTGQ
jgi:hypothetical protein